MKVSSPHLPQMDVSAPLTGRSVLWSDSKIPFLYALMDKNGINIWLWPSILEEKWVVYLKIELKTTVNQAQN